MVQVRVSGFRFVNPSDIFSTNLAVLNHPGVSILPYSPAEDCWVAGAYQSPEEFRPAYRGSPGIVWRPTPGGIFPHRGKKSLVVTAAEPINGHGPLESQLQLAVKLGFAFADGLDHYAPGRIHLIQRLVPSSTFGDFYIAYQYRRTYRTLGAVASRAINGANVAQACVRIEPPTNWWDLTSAVDGYDASHAPILEASTASIAQISNLSPRPNEICGKIIGSFVHGLDDRFDIRLLRRNDNKIPSNGSSQNGRRDGICELRPEELVHKPIKVAVRRN